MSGLWRRALRGRMTIALLAILTLVISGVASAQSPPAPKPPSLLERAEAWLNARVEAALERAQAAPPATLDDLLPRPQIRILATGNTGGISSRHIRVALDRAVTRLLVGLGQHIRTRYSGQGGVTDGHSILFTREGFGSTALTRFLAAPPFTRDVVDPDFPVLETNMGLVVQLDDPSPDLIPALAEGLAERWPDIRIELRDLRRVTWTNAEGVTVEGLERLTGLGERPELNPDPAQWSLIFTTVRATRDAPDDPEPHTLVTLLDTWSEGSRRVGLLKDRQRRARDGDLETLVLDAGNALDGYSYLAGETLSLHRPNDWRALADAGVSILSPAANELLTSPDALRAVAAEHGVEITSANVLLRGTDEPAFAPFIVREIGGHRVLVTGVTDPAVRADIPRSVAEQIEIRDPLDALLSMRPEIRRAAPDLVILLTAMPHEQIARLTPELEDVDLVLGDFNHRHYNEDATLVLGAWRADDRYHDQRHEPLYVHAGWGGQIAEIDVHVGPDGDVGPIRTRTLTVGPWLAPLMRWIEVVMRVRHAVYVDHEGVVLPDLDAIIRQDDTLRTALRDAAPFSEAEDEAAFNALLQQLPARLTPSLWQHLIANLLRDRTDTDVALLRELPWRHLEDGPLRQLDAMALLALPDRIQRHDIEGAALAKLLASLPPGVVMSGYDPVKRRVGGRPIEPARTYQLITTNELAAREPYRELLHTSSVHTRFTTEGWSIEAVDRGGEAVTLKHAVISGLFLLKPEELEQAGPDHDAWQRLYPDYAQRLGALLRPQGATLEPQWTLWIRDISLAFSQYSNVGATSPYEQVRETRATTPNNFNFVLGGDISLIYEDPDIAWETRVTTRFGEIRFDAEDKETADDLVASSEARFNLFNLLKESSSVRIVPFVNARFDTEYTQVDEARERQKELRSTLGLTTRFADFLRDVRFGLIAEVDFARDDRPFEAGLELGASFNVPLWAKVRFQSELGLRYYFPADGDNAEDLGLIVTATAALDIPILKRLSLDLYADLFLFQGKVAATQDIGTSLIFGVNLSYDRIFAF